MRAERRQRRKHGESEIKRVSLWGDNVSLSLTRMGCADSFSTLTALLED